MKVYSFKVKSVFCTVRMQTRSLAGFSIFLFLNIFLFSIGYSVLSTTAMVHDGNSDMSMLSGSILSSDDEDEDGLSDSLELMLGTDPNDSRGDLDNDGLYDHEEYLDLYGTPNNASDTPEYNYNKSMTYGNVLDIYHYFELSVNKTGYIRDDDNYTAETGGFTDYLLWNVNFTEEYAGGSNTSANVTYYNNVIVDTIFFGNHSGGSRLSESFVNYTGNVFNRVKFFGRYAGGSENADILYADNDFWNMEFSGLYAGGVVRQGDSQYEGFDVSYLNNSFLNVRFTGGFSGGGDAGLTGSGDAGASVRYENNSISYSIFEYSASDSGDTVFKNNYIFNGYFYGFYAGASYGVDAIEVKYTMYIGNHLEEVRFSSYAGGGAGDKAAVIYDGNNLTNVEFTGVKAGISENSNTTYINNILSNVSYSGLKGGYDDSNFTFTNNTIGADIYDSDGDGLGDLQELFIFGTYLYDKDSDDDGLNDSYEVNILNTDPTNVDTDGDTLNDSYEVTILRTNANNIDTDNDGLNDSYEVTKLKTNANNADTDNDGLNDGWEVQYRDAPGVNPLVTASFAELSSDRDNDGLTLLEEALANTNPEIANDNDNMNTTATLNTAEINTNGRLDTEFGDLSFYPFVSLFTFFTILVFAFSIKKQRKS